MRIGILAHSFSSAFGIYQAIRGHDVFIILSPSPHRSARTTYFANLARIFLRTLKNFTPLKLFATGKVIFLHGPLHDPKSVDTLKKLNLDVGLHKAGVIYRDVTIDAFRLGILNHHIGILPEYRGRSVLEWSLLQGDPVGVTVFFIDTGIDTGARILLAEEIDISNYKSVAEAKQYLFNLDRVFLPRALALLNESQTFKLNDGSGKRYYVMSKLFESVVEQLCETSASSASLR